MFNTITDIQDLYYELYNQKAELERTIVRLNEELSAVRKNNEALRNENKKLRKLLAANGIKPIPKNSRNSSTPPSKESIAATAVRKTKTTRQRSGLKPGGQVGHPGTTLTATEDPAETEDVQPGHCPSCGRDLTDVIKVLEGSFIKLCLPAPKPYFKRVNYYKCFCPDCGEQVHAPGFKGNSGNPVIYDDSVKAMAVYLSVAQSLPLNRIQRIMEDMYDVHISQGTIMNWIIEASDRSEPVIQEIIKRIKQSDIVGFDETSCYCEKKLRWVWIAQNQSYTYVFLGNSRRTEELEKVFGESLGNMIAVTDRHSSYFSYHFAGHQICMAHLLRDFQYLSDLNPDQIWSRKFSTLIREAINTRNNSPDAVIDTGPWLRRLDKLLYEDVNQLGEKFVTMQNGLLKYRDYIFPFLSHPRIPPTNNDSERGFRIVKIKMNNSMCFRSSEGAEAFFRLHSVIETAKKHGKSAYEAILALFGVEAKAVCA